MMKIKYIVTLLAGILWCFSAHADSIAMYDYIRLKTGMTEAEVLYRVGYYDHETVRTDYYNNVIQKTWYYIPRQDEPSNKKWISEIVFDGSGHVIRLDRYRP